jgi:lipid-A-disaccharide synthase
MSQKPVILVVAGEVSGDMHAAGLVRELNKHEPGVTVFGIGGPELRAAGAETLYDVKDMAVMGLAEVLRRYGFFRRVFRHILREAAARRPDAAVLVDYPGFNLRLAARLHAMGIKVIYYICPQVWAWNRSRIPRMARIVDRLLTIFPFEPDCFADTGLRADFVGHPLVEEAEQALRDPPSALPWPGEPRVAILPGSRPHEIRRILPAMWQAAGRVAESHATAGYLVAAPGPEQETLIREVVAAVPGGPALWGVVTGRTREVLRQARAAMVASGTATIETALMGCPMIVVYRVAPVTYHVFKHLVRVPHIGMVNIVAGRRACPEFVQHEATPEALAGGVLPLMDDGPERERMLAALREVRERLGAGDAAKTAAACVAEELGLVAPREVSRRAREGNAA